MRKLDRAGARLPVPVAVAVALGEPVGRTLAVRRAGLGADFHLHQPLGGEGDHIAKNVGVGGLLHQRAKVHHLVGHRRFLGLRLRFATRTYRKTADDRRKPLARYGAMESALRERLAPAELHHHSGHDRQTDFSNSRANGRQAVHRRRTGLGELLGTNPSLFERRKFQNPDISMPRHGSSQGLSARSGLIL